jgi:hypothetical protein
MNHMKIGNLCGGRGHCTHWIWQSRRTQIRREKRSFSTQQWRDLGDFAEDIFVQALDSGRVLQPQRWTILWTRQISRQQEELAAQSVQRVALPRLGQTGAFGKE